MADNCSAATCLPFNPCLPRKKLSINNAANTAYIRYCIVRSERSVAKLCKPRILSTAISLLSNKMQSIRINKKRFAMIKAPKVVSCTFCSDMGSQAVTYVQVKASNMVFKKPAFLAKASCLKGNNGKE